MRFLGVLSLFLLLAACRRSPLDLPPQVDPIKIDLPTRRVILYGDSRTASRGEQFFMGRTDPARERPLIVARIAAEKPDLIIHSGDLVARGASEDHWEDWDLLHKPLIDAKIPFHTVFGNHEYTGGSHRGLAHHAKRFPSQRGCRWFAVKAGPLLFAMLDSNFDDLPEHFIAGQGEWYVKTLKEADADPEIKAVIVVTHHPPYTNSTVHGPSEETRRRFADTARSCAKFRMYLAGHVHNYERFLIKGAHFVISGGGGAPQTAVRTSNYRTEPAFVGPEIRPFHYLLLTLGDAGAIADTMMLQPDDSWKSGDRFEIKW
jgi:3',5'-cyclic AMP phosphodiesterase CpdA